ncbi:DUF4145 domain-containing protein [Bradyrhizobium sp. CCGE-LA001]|uniref:DUF4145 domain-containing protein n=1 Tax=Bradyrhizobium sp. CCGE-LA001 TaxID=1223566 RepID=UPI0002AAA7FD|nr:DUF4145 domain-containing protein [Bradyrhizobium sp. CCGE-LA001]AMA55758.1 hypothetical protein BCCGELA001_05410 [Bradyrhizobium sp. CCGE-LA001]
MPPKEVTPQLGLDSFSCPHCNALAQQHWFDVLVKQLQRDKKPVVYESETVAALDYKKAFGDEDDQKQWLKFRARFEKNDVTHEIIRYGTNTDWQMVNVNLSLCHSCGGWAFWIKGKVAWPAFAVKIEPHPDLPGDIKEDFVEASTIAEASPRGSAALSRLIVQKLMSHFGGQGKDINSNIAHLVKNGLEPEIQMALDIVRVTGNNAVHPGELALKEDVGTALALLQLINLVVERRIATQKRIQEMFRNLPPGALEAIKKRDGVT